MKIAVVDYGMGNLRSVSKALERVAPRDQVVVTADPAATCSSAFDTDSRLPMP